MVLRVEKTRAAVGANIRTLLEEGKPRRQAIAIALEKAGRSQKPKTKKKKKK